MVFQAEVGAARSALSLFAGAVKGRENDLRQNRSAGRSVSCEIYFFLAAFFLAVFLGAAFLGAAFFAIFFTAFLTVFAISFSLYVYVSKVHLKEGNRPAERYSPASDTFI